MKEDMVLAEPNERLERGERAGANHSDSIYFRFCSRVLRTYSSVVSAPTRNSLLRMSVRLFFKKVVTLLEMLCARCFSAFCLEYND